MPLAPSLDTAGLLARDPVLWTTAAKALYGPNISITNSYPSNILSVDFPTEITSDAEALLHDLLNKLSNFLKANVTAYNITTSWAADNPTAPSLVSILNTTYEFISAKEQKRLVRDPFYADYAAVHDGRLPHVDPAPLERWSFGENSSSTLAEAMHNKTQFMDWFNSQILVRDPAACSNSLLVYVPRLPATTYRDTYTTGPQVPHGFSASRISVLSETPDMVVPIGQAAYNSTVTNHVEYLPVTVDFMAAKGCDGMIFSLVEDLLAAGIIGLSEVGASNSDGGVILSK